MSGQRTTAPGWTRSRLKYLAHFQAGEHITGESIRSDGDYPVYGGNGLRGFTEAYTHDGEFVLLGRQGALCGNVNYGSGRFWASEHAVVVRPKSGVNVRWLGELLRAMELRQYSMTAAQPGLSVDFVQNLPASIPPDDVQGRIAKYIDRETAEIDALVAEKERMFAIASEKRWALISDAVTHGLDASTALRDSGLPWLGPIPEYWNMLRGKYLWEEKHIPVHEADEMVTCFRDGEVTLRRNRREEGFTNAIKELGYQGVRAGQLVVHSMDAFAGAIGISDSDGKCTPEYIICEPISDKVYNPYYGLLLRVMALRRYIQAYCPAVRERAPRIHFSDLCNMYFPVPSREEQAAIVNYIRDRDSEFHVITKVARRSLELLRERRSALITAAVTGQIPIEEMRV